MRAAFLATSLAAAVAQPTQVQLHPSLPNKGEMSLDFVCTERAVGTVVIGAGSATATIPTTYFSFPNIGDLHQALLDFGRFGLAAGDKAWYQVSCGASTSANTTVTPIVATPRIAVFG